jgi:hypothetical protein
LGDAIEQGRGKGNVTADPPPGGEAELKRGREARGFVKGRRGQADKAGFCWVGGGLGNDDLGQNGSQRRKWGIVVPQV